MTQPTAHWWNNCPLRTYADAFAHFSTAKSKPNGKPLRQWARVYINGSTLEFYYGDNKGVKFGGTLFINRALLFIQTLDLASAYSDFYFRSLEFSVGTP